ncbi:hypothetical protein ACFTSF_06365 [Kribbella sp. NPDC056951]|uniref:Abi family protein n=1 Tax=Kribbella yunnanensis TaxID=190194 RepID=A0ABN2HZM2_9ACTN
MTVEIDWMWHALSQARLRPYVEKASGDLTAAAELYWWNVDISAAFYAPLQCFEVALRNAVHSQLVLSYGRVDWWAIAPLQEVSQRLVGAACRQAASAPREGTADDVVTELTLGFWVALLSRRYDRTLWVPHLHEAFPHYRGPRRRLHEELETIRLFRNRIMHHEPIHYRHLEADHRTILRVLRYVSPEMASHPAVTTAVEVVLQRRPPVLEGC